MRNKIMLICCLFFNQLYTSESYQSPMAGVAFFCLVSGLTLYASTLGNELLYEKKKIKKHDAKYTVQKNKSVSVGEVKQEFVEKSPSDIAQQSKELQDWLVSKGSEYKKITINLNEIELPAALKDKMSD